MEMSGEQLIATLCRRLNETGRQPTDAAIVNLLRSLSHHEVAQATDLGDVIEWHNDRIKKGFGA